MFAFFVNGEFKGWWQNEPGDEFFSNTCKKMKWNEEETELIWYEGVESSNMAITDFVKGKAVVHKIEIEHTEKERNGADGKKEKWFDSTEKKVKVKEIEPDTYYISGMRVKHC